MYILSRQLFGVTGSHLPGCYLGRQTDLASGRSRVNQGFPNGIQMRGLSARDIDVVSEPEETLEKKTENRFYTLARTGLATNELREKNRKIAESQMLTFSTLRIYGHWFTPLSEIQSIISARRELRATAQDLLDSEGNSACYAQQIDSLLKRVHPELQEVFKGDQETNLQAQKVLFDEYNYKDALNDGVFSNLRLYMRVYYPEDHKKLFYQSKIDEDLNKAMMDFIRSQISKINIIPSKDTDQKA